MILIMGVAGSGKSTQGRMLADQKGYAWLQSGEILRVLVTGTRRQEMLQGKLLNDEEMITIFDKVLELINPADEFVLDGFPRTIKQAQWLIDEAKKGRFTRILIFHLQASESIVHDRLKSRGRLDDTEEAIATRFEEYYKKTLPIIELLKQDGGAIVKEIDAAKDSEAIHAQIIALLNAE